MPQPFVITSRNWVVSLHAPGRPVDPNQVPRVLTVVVGSGYDYARAAELRLRETLPLHMRVLLTQG